MKHVALAALGVAMATGSAFAGFEIEKATTASQQVELELNNSVRVGGVTMGSTVSEHEVEVNYGALEFFEIGLGFEIENIRGQGARTGGFEAHTKFAVFGSEPGQPEQFFNMAIYSEFSFSFNDDDDREFSVGPILGFNFDPVHVTTNGFFVIPVGDSNLNTGFTYAVGAMYDVSDNFALGFEAHGEVPSVFAGAPPLSSQEHFIGPALSVKFEPEDDREVGLRLGSFFGLTSATPDVGVSANLELGF